MIRILMADDHAIVRDGLRNLFNSIADFNLMGEVDNGQKLLSFLKERGQELDLILLDLDMPGLSGLELISRVRADSSIPILIISMHAELQTVKGGIRAGANGYITKSASFDLLTYAIRKVAEGERFIAPELAEKMVFGRAVPNPTHPHEHLSEREMYVLRELVRGRSINAIASGLGLSNKTVSTYKSRLMEKLQLGTTTEMVRYGLMHGLAE